MSEINDNRDRYVIDVRHYTQLEHTTYWVIQLLPPLQTLDRMDQKMAHRAAATFLEYPGCCKRGIETTALRIMWIEGFLHMQNNSYIYEFTTMCRDGMPKALFFTDENEANALCKMINQEYVLNLLKNTETA